MSLDDKPYAPRYPPVIPAKETYGEAFFDSQAARSLGSAYVVLGRVFPLLRPRRMLDVGCGRGTWMRAALDLGVEEVVGTDGDYVDRSALLVDPVSFVPGDLATQSLRDVLGERADTGFDLVVCMEVAEHLPHGRSSSLVAEMASLADVVLFSAAVPFQYGTHHINEQWPEYWSILFRSQNFTCFDCLRAELWANPEVDWWYSQNALLFARNGSPAAETLPQQSRADGRGLALVHPENQLANLLGLPRRFRLAAAAEEFADLRSLVAADQRRDYVLPPLVAPARAARAPTDARDVFPWTRIEVYQPEQEIADLSNKLGETGHWLSAANQAFAAERTARLQAETIARRIDDVLAQSQTQAAARLYAETRLVELEAAEAGRRQALAYERQALLAEVDAAKQALQDQSTALDHRAAELAQRSMHLDSQIAQTDIVRQSLVWRVSHRAQVMAGRLRSIGRIVSATSNAALAALPAPNLADEVNTAPHDGQPTLSVETSTAEAQSTEIPPMKPQIKCYSRHIGEVNWWTLAAAETRLRRFEIFDAEDYLVRNPDVAAANVNPYTHFIQSGALEGRGQVDLEDLARLMSGFTLFDHAIRALPPQEDQDAFDLPGLVADINHVGIFVSSHGNVFMEDLADDLATDLRSVGVRTDVLDESADIDARPPICLFMAPHEFFTLGHGPDWVRDDVLSEGFMFGTEQVQTSWFNVALPFILMSRGMLDICSQTADLFRRIDMAALHVLPGARLRPRPLTERDRHHPLFSVLPLAAQGDINPSLPFVERPIDIAFFGTSSPRRDQFFARNAAFFAEYEVFNYCRRLGRGPIRSDGEDGALTRLAAHVAGYSKIMLNIHREEFGYFEWHRMVRLGMCSGSLIVSDPCLPHPSFVANEHYLQQSARHIPDLLEWLLTTSDGAREVERVRSNANTLITDIFETRRTAMQMLRFLAQHRSREGG